MRSKPFSRHFEFVRSFFFVLGCRYTVTEISSVCNSYGLGTVVSLCNRCEHCEGPCHTCKSEGRRLPLRDSIRDGRERLKISANPWYVRSSIWATGQVSYDRHPLWRIADVFTMVWCRGWKPLDWLRCARNAYLQICSNIRMVGRSSKPHAYCLQLKRPRSFGWRTCSIVLQNEWPWIATLAPAYKYIIDSDYKQKSHASK